MSVEEYLRALNREMLETYAAILGASTSVKKSTEYFCKECREADPFSPIVLYLNQSEKPEKAWANLMKIGERVFSERGLNLEKYLPTNYGIWSDR